LGELNYCKHALKKNIYYTQQMPKNPNIVDELVPCSGRGRTDSHHHPNAKGKSGTFQGPPSITEAVVVF